MRDLLISHPASTRTAAIDASNASQADTLWPLGGSAEALKTELAESQPALLGYLSRQLPSMYGKAYRWVAELEEIAAFVGDDRDERAMLEAAARFYERIAADVDGEKKEVGALVRFLKS